MVSTRSRKRKQIGGTDKDTYAEADVLSAIKGDEETGATNPACWAALSFIIIARKDLPEGHAIVQSRGGTDSIEKTFCKSRGDNRAATAQGTDGATANNQVSFLMKIVKAKGKTGHVKEIETREINDTMVKKRRII